MTYNKPKKGISIATIKDATYLAIDTADGDRIGTYATDAFNAKKTIKAKNEDAEVLIPFHAVKRAQCATISAEAERTDPYCADSDANKVTITVYQGRGNGIHCDEPLGTFKAEKGVATKIPDSIAPEKHSECCLDGYMDSWVAESGSVEIRGDGVYVTTEVDTAVYPMCQQTT